MFLIVTTSFAQQDQPRQPSLSSGEGSREMISSTQEMPVKFEAADIPLMSSGMPGLGWLQHTTGLGIANTPLSWTKIDEQTGHKAKKCQGSLHSFAGRGPGNKKFHFNRVCECRNPITGEMKIAYIYRHCSSTYDLVIREVNNMRLHFELCNGENASPSVSISILSSERPIDETTAPRKQTLWFPPDMKTIKVRDVQHVVLNIWRSCYEWLSEYSSIRVLQGGKALNPTKVLFKQKVTSASSTAMTQSKRNVGRTPEEKTLKKAKCGTYACVGGGTRDSENWMVKEGEMHRGYVHIADDVKLNKQILGQRN